MASGESLLFFNALSFEPAATSAALHARNNRPVLDFDDTTNESAIFSAIMPLNYAGTTGVTVYIHYAMTSATSGDIDWDISFELVGDGDQDIDSDGFAAANSVDNTTVPATSGHVDVVSVAFTDGADMDSVTAGDAFRLKITRDAASDTASGDAELVAVEIRET